MMTANTATMTIAEPEQPPLPDGPKAVTPEWLTAVLRRRGVIRQAVVQAIQLEPIDERKRGVTSEIIRFWLTYGKSDKKGPALLFGKFSHPDPAARAAINALGSYQREIGFYQDLTGICELPVPACYYSALDPKTGASALLLEDLNHLRTVDFVAGCNPLEAELVIDHLAQLHISGWNNPRFHTMSWLRSFAQDAMERQEKFQGWWRLAPQKYQAYLPGHRLPPSLVELGHHFSQQAARIFTQLAEPPLTCVHADCHVMNLFFGLQEDVPLLRLVDWQAARLGRGMIDVAYFMCTSLPVDQRRQTEQALVHRYYDRLRTQGIRDYSWDQCWTDYRRAAFWPFSVIASVTALLDMASEPRRMLLRAWYQRLVAFSEDHALAELL